jgi:hypothetical protein
MTNSTTRSPLRKAQRGLVACLAGLVAAMPVALIADTPVQAVGAVTSVAPTTFTNKTTSNGLGNNLVWGVFASGSTVYAATDGGLSIYTNGGTSFTNRTTADVHGVAVDHHAGLGLTMMDQTCLSWTLVNGARGGATLQAVLA